MEDVALMMIERGLRVTMAKERERSDMFLSQPDTDNNIMHRLWDQMGAMLRKHDMLKIAAALCVGWAALRLYDTFSLRIYGRDMTASAAGENDPVIGRDAEIDRVIRILCRRTKNCAALVGAAGVGKTAIVEGLARRIAAGEVPPVLAGARVVEVDVGALVAGTMFRGMLEARVKALINAAEAANGKVILFFDEIHMLLGAGAGEGSHTDGANLLKPALARGRIRCVGATTLDEYRYVERDAALERRFQKVYVGEPSAAETTAILRGLKQRYQKYYGLEEIQDAALVAAANLAARYITDRQLPDKAIDVIDDACAIAGARRAKSVSPVHVAEIVSQWTGIPINTLDQEKEKTSKLSTNLADRLHDRVVGQDEAVTLVAQAMLRSRSGLDQPGQPIGSFLFLGSTGVGKTELAKALAEQLFHSDKMLLRVDMSEYVTPESLSRLIGPPPSRRGGGDGGGGGLQLTERVRRRPYSVILFDEVEKADPLVLNVLLQLLDDSVLTDGQGRNVDFTNTLIIMTSNLGAEHLTTTGLMAGEDGMKAARGLLMDEVHRYFRPEFLNRLTEMVIFEPLSRGQLKEVVKIQMRNTIARAAGRGIKLSATDAALDVILSESYNPVYGARPVRRWVQKNVVTVLSEMMAKGEVGEGSTVAIDAADDKKGLEYQVVKKAEEEMRANIVHFGMPWKVMKVPQK